MRGSHRQILRCKKLDTYFEKRTSPSEADTRGPLSWRSQHLITSPPGHPREERTWVDGVKGGAPPRPRGLERKRLPGAEGPPEGKDKDAMLRSSLAAGGGAVV